MVSFLMMVFLALLLVRRRPHTDSQLCQHHSSVGSDSKAVWCQRQPHFPCTLSDVGESSGSRHRCASPTHVEYAHAPMPEFRCRPASVHLGGEEVEFEF